jgi:hypothetical protein
LFFWWTPQPVVTTHEHINRPTKVRKY